MFDLATLRKKLKKRSCSVCTHHTKPDQANASVLIPLIVRESISVLFTKRSQTLSHHAGQVSFPGGHVETSDQSFCKTALRETFEEIGLPSDKIEVLCCLEPYITHTHTHIIPVVGLITPPFNLTLEPLEVDTTFEVPLDFLCQEAHWGKKCVIRSSGKKIQTHILKYETHDIWGITASILNLLKQRIMPK